MVIKKLLRLIFEDIHRFFYNKHCTFCFLFKGAIVRKPKHISNKKYIHLGKNVNIDSGSRLDCYINEDEIPNLVICDNTMISFNCTLLCTTNLIIGNDCMFASDVFISTENHNMNPETNFKKGKLVSKDIKIGNGCWIGEKVIIVPGVTIGNHSIIGAGSVVTKDIPDYCMAVGNPARVIKKYDINNKTFLEINEASKK